MRLVGAGGQQERHSLFAADGSITAGGTAQLVLAQSQARSYLLLQNTSAGPLWFEIGTGRAHATLSGNTVGSVTVDNAGFNFTKPPLVRFWGGGIPNNGGLPGNSSYLGLNQPSGASPPNVATGRAILGGGAIGSIVVDNPGAGYVIAPYVAILNNDLDPYGAAVPSNGVGILVPAGTFKEWNGTICPTDSVAVWGATTGQTFTARWLD